MREIIFRGKRIDNGEWVEGHYHYSNWYLPPSMKIVDTTHHILPVGYGDSHKVAPETVGQFTGLTDKNGKRAFEHDAIKHHFGDEIGVIRYGEYRNPFGDDSHGGHVGFYVDWVTGRAPGILRKDLAYWMKIVEILGNIHDNRDLLEVQP